MSEKISLDSSVFKDKFRKVNRINKTFFGKSAEYIIFVPAFHCYMQNVCKKAL